MASGEMTRDQFTAFLSSAFANLVAHTLDGSIHLSAWADATWAR
jgi:hypothetical protein